MTTILLGCVLAGCAPRSNTTYLDRWKAEDERRRGSDAPSSEKPKETPAPAPEASDAPPADAPQGALGG